MKWTELSFLFPIGFDVVYVCILYLLNTHAKSSVGPLSQLGFSAACRHPKCQAISCLLKWSFLFKSLKMGIEKDTPVHPSLALGRKRRWKEARWKLWWGGGGEKKWWRRGEKSHLCVTKGLHFLGKQPLLSSVQTNFWRHPSFMTKEHHAVAAQILCILYVLCDIVLTEGISKHLDHAVLASDPVDTLFAFSPWCFSLQY